MGRAAQIVHADLLDLRSVEQLLFERIDESHAAHDHVLIWQRRVELGVETHDLERSASRDGDGHSA